jgi:DNA-binding GntR family transcriptional regulator
MKAAMNLAVAAAEPAAAAVPDLSISQRSLPEQVADAIVRGIAGRLISPGERLYEVGLVARLGVSRAPIREALRILQAQGVVEGEPQRGQRVALFDAVRIAEVYELRHALERITVRRAAAALHAEPGRGARLRRIVADMAIHADRGDILAMNEADLDFHAELCRLAGNAVLMNIWRGLQRQILIILALETTPDVPLAAIHAQHVSLLAVMQGGDAARLEDEITRHIAAPSDPGWPGVT